ncbi:MAG: threonine synthase [Candidatus Marinimicrobia bacterium]|nr:threonine synthase [Candidatus Neomarinimicrobiota bacterium]
MVFICTDCGKEFQPSDKPTGICSCGQPLAVQYLWEGLERRMDFNSSDESLWRYSSVLPGVPETEKISLGEGFTPLLPIQNELGIDLYIKDETKNPTGSFKDRGMALAVSMAKKQGVESICLPSAGNAGIAAAAYCQKAGIECHVFLPETIPPEFVVLTKSYDAKIYLKGESIAETGKYMAKVRQKHWFDISTLKEPFRVEGKKTMGYEIAEQLGWTFPDVVIYPTGGGTGLIGMWKAFNEIVGLGWANGSLPRMVAAQSSTCAPVVKAFQNGKNDIEFWNQSSTEALGLNVPGPIGGRWMLRILKESGGTAISVDEANVKSATLTIHKKTTINASLEVGVTWLGLKKLIDSNWINPGQTVVLPITGVER